MPLGSVRLAEVRIDAVDVAIAADAVVQALPLAGRLAPLPRRAGALAGVVDHGGALVPVVDLARWVGTGAPDDGRDARILVLRDGGRTLGLRVSNVGGLVDVAPDGITRLHHDDDADEVFHSAALSPETGRILSVLDVGRLAALACAWNDGAAAAPDAPMPATAAHALRPYALLDAGLLCIGVPAGLLAEVIPMPARAPIGDGAWCTWRGRHLAIVPLAALVPGAADTAGSLLAVLEHDGLALGVPVRATLRLAQLPHDAQQEDTVYDDDGAAIRLVDVAALFARRPEAALSRPVHDAAPARTGAGTPNDAAYIVFEADGLAAAPLGLLAQVLPLAAAPGATMRWEDRALPVVDLRRAGHAANHSADHSADHAAADAGQVLVVRTAAGSVACVVARVHVMIPAGAGRLYRLGAGAFITTDDGARHDDAQHDGGQRATYRIVDLAAYIQS